MGVAAEAVWERKQIPKVEEDLDTIPGLLMKRQPGEMNRKSGRRLKPNPIL